MTYTIAVYTVKTPDDGQRNCPKYAEFYFKNKFEKFVHLVGFISRKCGEFLLSHQLSVMIFMRYISSFDTMLWADNNGFLFLKRRYQTPGNYYLINTHHEILKSYSNSKLLKQSNSHEREHLFSYLSESLLGIIQDLLECSSKRKSW